MNETFERQSDRCEQIDNAISTLPVKRGHSTCCGCRIPSYGCEHYRDASHPAGRDTASHAVSAVSAAQCAVNQGRDATWQWLDVVLALASTLYPPENTSTVDLLLALQPVLEHCSDFSHQASQPGEMRYGPFSQPRSIYHAVPIFCDQNYLYFPVSVQHMRICGHLSCTNCWHWRGNAINNKKYCNVLRSSLVGVESTPNS